jgi:hypothetical protein
LPFDRAETTIGLDAPDAMPAPPPFDEKHVAS